MHALISVVCVADAAETPYVGLRPGRGLVQCAITLPQGSVLQNVGRERAPHLSAFPPLAQISDNRSPWPICRHNRMLTRLTARAQGQK